MYDTQKKPASTTIIQADTVNAKLTGTDGNLLTLNWQTIISLVTDNGEQNKTEPNRAAWWAVACFGLLTLT